jgi:hypothetical protein
MTAEVRLCRDTYDSRGEAEQSFFYVAPRQRTFVGIWTF